MTAFEFDEPKAKGTNQAAAPSKCDTCGGDRYVTVRLRTSSRTIWMDEHKIAAATHGFHEEVAPCPDCNPVEVTYWRLGDKTPFRTMDPAATRQALAG